MSAQPQPSSAPHAHGSPFDENGVPPWRPTSAPSPLAWLALLLIGLYRRVLSPALPPACRFQPTCSEYGYEAIARYGILAGGRLALWRILRCNPFGGSGYDPVP
ncbi:MAG: membrane protein insertion efficiency factor YidD [Thermomicrobiales bacterium]